MERLTAGTGFESERTSYSVGDFILVDARVAAGLRAPLHAHERAYITLILAGGFEEHYRFDTLDARAGTLIFDPGDTAHRTRSGGARVFRMELSASAMALARDAGPVLREPAIFTHAAHVSMARRILAQVRGARSGWQLVAQGLLMELVGHIVWQEGRREPRTPPRWLREVKDRLDSDFAALATLAELARPAGVHPVHLARAFRSSYGSSIGDYRRARQIAKAELLLTQSAADLSEIALACGFADQSHFSAAFRRSVGMPPGRYRRACAGPGRHRNGESDDRPS